MADERSATEIVVREFLVLNRIPNRISWEIEMRYSSMSASVLVTNPLYLEIHKIYDVVMPRCSAGCRERSDGTIEGQPVNMGVETRRSEGVVLNTKVRQA